MRRAGESSCAEPFDLLSARLVDMYRAFEIGILQAAWGVSARLRQPERAAQVDEVAHVRLVARAAEADRCGEVLAPDAGVDLCRSSTRTKNQ